jgi:DNA-directed RNA polymerase subunit beta'
VPSQDVVLGLYYMTRERINARGEGMVFADGLRCTVPTGGQVDLQARIKVRIARLWPTTAQSLSTEHPYR